MLYCQYWHRKLEKHPLVAFPKEMCPIVAKLTEGFSFAYLKELFIASLLVVARGVTADDDEEQTTSGSSSSTDAVLVEACSRGEAGSEPRPASGDASSKDGHKATAPVSKIRVIPKIDVPDELQGHALLAIIRAQAQSLLDEMDNSEDRPVAGGKVHIEDDECC